MPAELPIQTPSRYSLWESPDRSIAIYLAFETIDAINRALAQIAAAPPVRGAEIGGLLLGKSERGARLTVWIDDFEPIPCSYPRGPSWILTETEDDEFAGARNPASVGFFRSHTRKDLFLSNDDKAFFARHFPGPDNVFLLVKPFTTRPSAGGFFYWEGGSLSRASHGEFPFHRRELGGGDPVPVPVPASNAWLRNEPNLLDPPPPNPRHRRPRFVKTALLAGLVALAVAGYLGYTPRRNPPPTRKAAPSGTLRLTATEGNKNVVLAWDSSSPLLAGATRGAVEIAEGTFHKTVDLAPEDLHSGRLIYSRPDAIGDTVSFKMRVETAQGEPFTEAIRFVSREPLAIAAPPVVETKPIAVAKPKPAPKPPPPPEIEKTNPIVVIPPAKPPEPPKLLRPAPRREP